MNRAVIRNRTIFVALFAALIAVTCFVAIPAGPLGVPIVMQNMMVLLAGALLGARTGGLAVFLFLAAGALGLPVFSGGTGGFAKFVGPTGGFLAGYFFGALLTGLILGLPSIRSQKSIAFCLKVTGALLAGKAVIYLLGILWLAKTIAGNTSNTFLQALPAALSAGLFPFIPGAIIKLIISVPLVIVLRPIAARYINPEKHG